MSVAHLNQSDVFLAAWLSSPAAPLPTSSLIAPLIAHHHRSFMASGELLTSSSLHPEPIRDSPSRMSWSEPTESSSCWQLPPPLPPCPPPFCPSSISTLPPLCVQPRDLICLVISGLACSAQLHSKVKLDECTGASPCKKRFTLTAAGVGSGLQSSARGRGWRPGCGGRGNDVPGRKTDTGSLILLAEEFYVRKESGLMKGLKWRQRSRCRSTTTRRCSISSHGDSLARQLMLQHVRYILASTDMNLPNGEHETSLFHLLTFAQAATIKIVTILLFLTRRSKVFDLFLICFFLNIWTFIQFSCLPASYKSQYCKSVLQLCSLNPEWSAKIWLLATGSFWFPATSMILLKMV